MDWVCEHFLLRVQFLILIIRSSARNNAIDDEIEAFDQFQTYIKDNPESEAALAIKSAGRKRKAFCTLEADEEDGDGSEAGEGCNEGDQGDNVSTADHWDGNERGSGTGNNNEDNAQTES
jgi:hypothetical protein